MIKIFGREICNGCQQKKKEFKENNIEFIYYDLDTDDGLAEAAFRGLLKDDMILPIIIEEN